MFKFIRRKVEERRRELDEQFLLPAIEREADRRGLVGAERKAMIALAWELHEQASKNL